MAIDRKDLEPIEIELDGGDYTVVCFDCQNPHTMSFSSWLQAEATAAIMTRNARPCPKCGCTTWVAMGDAALAIDGQKAKTFESMDL